MPGGRQNASGPFQSDLAYNLRLTASSSRPAIEAAAAEAKSTAATASRPV